VTLQLVAESGNWVTSPASTVTFWFHNSRAEAPS
jgi:hypothetical protein